MYLKWEHGGGLETIQQDAPRKGVLSGSHSSGTFEIWGIAKDIGKHCNKCNKNLVCRHIVQELIAH
jgi:hypothetical protein